MATQSCGKKYLVIDCQVLLVLLYYAFDSIQIEILIYIRVKVLLSFF